MHILNSVWTKILSVTAYICHVQHINKTGGILKQIVFNIIIVIEVSNNF